MCVCRPRVPGRKNRDSDEYINQKTSPIYIYRVYIYIYSLTVFENQLLPARNENVDSVLY